MADDHEPTSAAAFGKQARGLLDDGEREARAERDKVERDRANENEPGRPEPEPDDAEKAEPEPQRPEPVVTTPDDEPA
jgi:hypothetical protein